MAYETALAAAEKVGRAWGCTCGEDPVDADPGGGIPQRWTAGTWDDRLARARRSGEPFAARGVRTFPEAPGQGQPL